MSHLSPFHAPSTIATLRRMARPREAGERCDFCSAPLAQAHRHLLEIAPRKIICACDPCAIRFQDVAGGRFKLIPRDVRSLPGFLITDGEWDSLALPINLTFFYRDSTAGRVIAMYPSPAGATESLLPAANWETLEDANPALRSLEADVEALLVNRISATREYFIAPMDVCYELVGLIRTNWRGLFGGDELWARIRDFFDGLRARAVMMSVNSNSREAVRA